MFSFAFFIFNFAFLRASAVSQNCPTATSSIASFSTARQSPQISVPEFTPSERTTASFMLSQAAQPVVGSPDSGSTGVIALLWSNSPVFSVTNWNDVRQSPQTWFHQHLGSQE